MNDFNNFDPNDLKNLNLEGVFGGFKTDSKTKWLVLLTIVFLPWILFITIFSPSFSWTVIQVSEGISWAISMAWFVGALLVLTMARKYIKQIKYDMYPIITGSIWGGIAIYTLWIHIGWWTLLVSIGFNFFFYIVTYIITFIFVVITKKRAMEKALTNNPNMEAFFEDISNNFDWANGEYNSDSINSKKTQSNMKQTLDDILRDEGIDIDKLDEQFGSYFETKIEITQSHSKIKSKKKTETIIEDETIISNSSNTNKEQNEEEELEGKTIIDIESEEVNEEQKK